MLDVRKRINMEQFIEIQPAMSMVLGVVIGTLLILHYFPDRPFAGSLYVGFGMSIIMTIVYMQMPRWQSYLSKKFLAAPLYRLNKKRCK